MTAAPSSKAARRAARRTAADAAAARLGDAAHAPLVELAFGLDHGDFYVGGCSLPGCTFRSGKQGSRARALARARDHADDRNLAAAP